jgi:hypothetical protein
MHTGCAWSAGVRAVLAVVALSTSPARAQRPANDDLATAAVISGADGSLTTTSLGTTAEPGEPVHYTGDEVGSLTPVAGAVYRSHPGGFTDRGDSNKRTLRRGVQRCGCLK